jgi:CBS domain-containing protein
MLRVRDIMTLDVVTVSPGSTLRETAETLATAGVTGAPVVAGGDVVGVVSASDLALFAADAPGSPTEREFREDPTAPSEEEEGISATPDDPAAAYFLAYWSDVGANVAERLANPDAPEWNVFDDHTVDEVMTTSVSSVRPDDSVQESARYMLRTGVHRVLVMEDGHLAGLLSTTDVVKAVAQYGLGG